MNEEGLIHQIHEALPDLSGQYAQELAGIITRIVDALTPARIYVFGSQARGDATDESDVDLLLVMENSETPEHRIAQAAYRAATPYSFSLDILVMSQEIFNRRSRAVASLPAKVLREGQLLYAA
ncbi:MAG TPA: nucleotidyltransferase domain-containing protein [Thermomicrobiales bacterium]|nr:nucleotidyltransferase domain-containing protein [Thermomicrobiales bacterium]